MARIRVAVVMACVWMFASVPSGEQRTDPGGVTIAWPNDRHPTLQAAIDAAPDGATIAIGRGRHETPAVVIRGRHLTITGAGSGRKRDGSTRTGGVSALVGPTPRPVARDGRVILPVDEAIAQLQIIGGSVTIRDLAVSGFDAGISIRDEDREQPARVRLEDMVISHTGRGLWTRSVGPLTIQNATIEHTLWNGLSFVPFIQQASYQMLYMNAVSFFSSASACVLVGANGYAIMDEVQIGNCAGPGIAVQGNAAILDSILTSNHGGGILLDQAKNNPLIRGNTLTSNRIFGVGVQGATGEPNIQENQIISTQPDSNGQWGDGIFIVLSEVWVTANTITTSNRAGLSNFGGTAHLADTSITCSGFDLEGEDFFGQDFAFDDDNGNHCGCPQANGSCVAVSVGLQPPDAIAPDP